MYCRRLWIHSIENVASVIAGVARHVHAAPEQQRTERHPHPDGNRLETVVGFVVFADDGQRGSVGTSNIAGFAFESSEVNRSGGVLSGVLIPWPPEARRWCGRG